MAVKIFYSYPIPKFRIFLRMYSPYRIWLTKKPRQISLSGAYVV